MSRIFARVAIAALAVAAAISPAGYADAALLLQGGTPNDITNGTETIPNGAINDVLSSPLFGSAIPS